MDENPPNVPDDLRRQGWSVAVHNDYRLQGVPNTFWLLTKPFPPLDPLMLAVHGEGRTDAEALGVIRNKLRRSAEHPKAEAT